jgi:hypothetical protein
LFRFTPDGVTLGALGVGVVGACFTELAWKNMGELGAVLELPIEDVVVLMEVEGARPMVLPADDRSLPTVLPTEESAGLALPLVPTVLPATRACMSARGKRPDDVFPTSLVAY